MGLRSDFLAKIEYSQSKTWGFNFRVGTSRGNGLKVCFRQILPTTKYLLYEGCLQTSDFFRKPVGMMAHRMDRKNSFLRPKTQSFFFDTAEDEVRTYNLKWSLGFLMHQDA